MNRGELVTRVSLVSGLNDTGGDPERTLMEDWANEAVVAVLQATRCYQQEGQTTLTSGENHYTADPSILMILDWQFPDLTDYERVSVDEARDLTRVGSYRRVYAMEYRDFWINPAPTSALIATFTYVPKPTKMTADGHDPSNTTYGGIPDQYHKALEYYMLWQAAMYDEKKLPQSPKDYLDLFNSECKDIRVEGLRSGGRRVARMRVGYPASLIGTTRNDVYP